MTNKIIEKGLNNCKKFKAVCGFYGVSDLKKLSSFIDKSILNGDRELSNALNPYYKTQKTKVVATESWYDFGRVFNYLKIRNKFENSRSFNNLTTCQFNLWIEKVSKNKSKIHDEFNWYNKLPTEFCHLFLG